MLKRSNKNNIIANKIMSIRLYELEAELNINPVILPNKKPDYTKVNMEVVDPKFISLNKNTNTTT